MKIAGISFCIAAIGLSAGAAWAETTTHDVKITNSGKQPVVALSASPPGQNDWGSDMLGVRTIKSGQTVTVKVKSDGCQVDFQAVMDDGNTVEKAGVDICAAGALVSF